MTSCNHSSLHPKSVFTIDTLLFMFEHNYIYTQYYFPFALFGGGEVKGINRRGGGALFVISFLQNGQLSFLFS